MRFFFSLIPYLLVTLAAFVLFIISYFSSGNLRDLLIGIATTFFSIPSLYLVYDLTRRRIEKKLQVEIRDYAKVHIDKGILSIIKRLQTIVYKYEDIDPTLKGINTLLSLDSNSLRQMISKNEYFGFQIFKNWDVDEKELHNVINNSFMLKFLGNDQIITIIELIKSLRILERFYGKKEIFLNKNLSINPQFRIIHGSDISKKNSLYPDRYLLLKDIGDQKFVVIDFGDFTESSKENLTYMYVILEEMIKPLSDCIIYTIELINKWLKLTDYEFLIDLKSFKLAVKK